MTTIYNKIRRKINKIRRKGRNQLIESTRHTYFYPYIYGSYWHYLLHKKNNMDVSACYYSARPSAGAGIGHQLANWIAGYWYARQFNLKFAHLPFPDEKWETFLGLGLNEVKAENLKKEGYKTRKLPLFNEFNREEVALNKKIIRSYGGQKVLFIAEQDQFYKDQYGVVDDLKTKFFAAPSRDSDVVIYQEEHFNIAVHVRRGDIMADPGNPNLTMRFLSNDYFEKVLHQTINSLQVEKPLHIYFFSQGKPEDYPEFEQYPNLHWCLDMHAQETFLHFVYADLLITSKSSFSYKPALLNNGVKICPRDFWHGYPPAKDWILAENHGEFNVESLKKIK